MSHRARNSALLLALTAAGITSTASAQDAPPPTQAASPAQDENAMLQAQSWEVLRVTPPPISNTVIVKGSIEDAWALWTQSDRMTEFMGFDAEIEAKAGGAYRVIFAPDADTPLARGNDGIILAMEPHKMLSFSWMTPMHMKGLQGNSTVVTLHFTELNDGRGVQVDLINTGYGLSKDWRAAYSYNVRGWDRVLTHFEYAIEVGPIDWVKRAKDLKRDGTLPMWREYRRKVANGIDPLAKK